jgi:hypothetical protein
MFYFDTSFLAPLILEEKTGGAVEHFMAGLPVETLAVSGAETLYYSSLTPIARKK